MLKFRSPTEEMNAVMNALQSGLDSEHTEFSMPYLFSTENLIDGLDALETQAGVEFKDKNVLACASAGDFKLAALLKGAARVEHFDKNLLAKYMVDFKERAVEYLSYNNCMELFNTKYPMNFIKTVTYLSNKMEVTSAFYWNMIIQSMMKDIMRNVPGVCSPFGETSYAYNISKIPYVADKNLYAELQNKKIPKSEFYCDDVQNLPAQLKGKKYDIIYLSNIACYAEEMFVNTKDLLKAFNNAVVQPMSNLLNPGGHILVSYVYHPLTNNGAASLDWPINHQSKREEAFAGARDMVYREVAFAAQDRHTRNIQDKYVVLSKTK